MIVINYGFIVAFKLIIIIVMMIRIIMVIIIMIIMIAGGGKFIKKDALQKIAGQCVFTSAMRKASEFDNSKKDFFVVRNNAHF